MSRCSQTAFTESIVEEAVLAWLRELGYAIISAQAEFLATEDFRRGVVVTLLSGVAAAYFQLLALDRELEIAQETAASYRNTLDLFQQKYEGGGANQLPLDRAAAQLANAEANIPQLERTIADTENQLSILASCWGVSPAPSRAAGSATNSGCRQRFRPACPPNCWNGAPTCVRPKNSWSVRTRSSASPKPISFRA